MNFEIKTQNMQQLSTWLCSKTITQILQVINVIYRVIEEHLVLKEIYKGTPLISWRKGCSQKDLYR